MMQKIMIVEDDFRIAEINKAFVEQVEGFKVIGTALNGKEFMKMLEKEVPDLILLDIYIPDISGKDLLLHLKQNYPQVEIIMITAAKEAKTLEFFLRHGIFDYLIKPVDANRLHKSLRKFILYKEKLKKEVQLEQKDIDNIMDRSSAGNEYDNCPKGIDPYTLECIENFINKENNCITVEEAEKILGISKSTARRYLDYLVTTGAIVADLRYGTVGRPVRVYRK
jgi:two-component system, CitB family, response regulator